MKNRKNLISWIAAALVTTMLVVFFTTRLLGDDRLVFTPGAMTHGHHQIEMACDACHTPFAGVKQQACTACHGERLEASNDSHPKKKFDDPRNADRLRVLDARSCVTCHREHRPQQTRAMGVTLPHDYCFHCHQEIGDERPSHQGLAFESCASAGCHNYHDNTALYEDFLAKHAGEPALLPARRVPERDLAVWVQAALGAPRSALGRDDHDAPRGIEAGDALNDWAASVHARAGINCSDCHQPGEPRGALAAWVDKPGLAACTQCHDAETKGFQDGKHGMRVKQRLPPMTPAQARLPMHADARDQQLGCTSCHGPHDVDTRRAAVDACVGCHDDTHSRAYQASPHYRVWLAGEPSASCATCHLPRQVHTQNGITGVRVQHNQNWNLRPNEKMLKGVCMGCHGLGFAMDALVEPALIANNFNGKPSRHVESIEWAANRAFQSKRGEKR